MKKRILYIAKNIPIPTRKSNNVILRIAKMLNNLYEIDILYPNEIVPWGLHYFKKYKPYYKLKPWEVNEKQIQVINYIRLPFQNIAFLFSKLSILKYFKKNPGYDLIHAHFILPDGVWAMKLGRKWNIPYVVTVRASDITLLKKVRYKSDTWRNAKEVLSKAHKIHFLNVSIQAFIKSKFNIEGVIIPHGIENEIFDHKLTFNKSKNHVIITVVSEAIARKNLNWVIQAVSKYKGEKDISLKIIGEGVLLNEYKKQAFNILNIQFLGNLPRKEVINELIKSDIFALPSINESFGLVYLEAAATKNAIIGYKGTGVYGLLINNIEAVFIDGYNQFEYQLFDLIKSDKRRIMLAENAYKKVQEITWNSILKKYEILYNKLT